MRQLIAWLFVGRAAAIVITLRVIGVDLTAGDISMTENEIMQNEDKDPEVTGKLAGWPEFALLGLRRRTKNANLIWEAEWIVANQDKYDSPMHAAAVIGNIEKRYWIDEAKRIAKLASTDRYFCNRLIEHCGAS